MKRIPSIICLILFALVAMPAMAQGSLYLKGGISTANGVDFKNVNPSIGVNISPEIGGGFSYEMVNGLRLGANYEFTKLRREQRLSALEPTAPRITQPGATYSGGTAYREMWSHFNNADISVEYNFATLMPAVKAAGIGLYLGTGVGAAFAEGNKYEISMAHEELRTESASEDTWTLESWLEATNTLHNYKSVYVPFNFNAEFELTKIFSMGVRCEYKLLFSKEPLAPKGLLTAGLVMRLKLF